MAKAGLTRLKAGLAAAGFVWLAACATDQPPRPAPALPPPPPPAAQPAPPPAPKPPPPAPDQCGASGLQGLIGHQKTEIPIPLEPRLRRVVCTTCPVTQDFVPNRQTIRFDAATGTITSITCG
ncbi:proteinase inhibitor i78 [Caulobacter sp. KR2-114]|uniref:proteinase inhibitor i78 n=1 Tax=Caulobacter sp. KR2-114 TaxID=3400912 RepID=UPI003C0E325D